jgi:uncharacterized protein YjiS (DUF1127 family)
LSCGSTTSSRSATPTIGIVQPQAVRVPSPFGWLETLKQKHERWQQRRALLDLSDHLLEDIGITREKAEREGGKPFWY